MSLINLIMFLAGMEVDPDTAKVVKIIFQMAEETNDAFIVVNEILKYRIAIL